MFIKLKGAVFLSFVCLLASCASINQIVKTNRDEYQINDRVQVDSNIIRAYLPFKEKLDAEMSKVIGYSDVVLSKASTTPESVLGNFFADAVWSQSKKIEPKIDFVFPTTRGGIRNDVAKGPITVAQVFEMMPFENELVLFELKGTAVYKLLTFIAMTNGQPVAGLSMSIKNKLPEDIMINGKAFDRNRTYLVLTSDYIASGGDDAQGFTDPISRKNLGLKVRDALLREVLAIQAAGKKINATLDGRIKEN